MTLDKKLLDEDSLDGIKEVLDGKQDTLAFPGDESLFLNGARGFSKPPSGGSYSREQLIDIIGTFQGATTYSAGRIGLVPAPPELPVDISTMSWADINTLASKVKANPDKYAYLIGQTKSFLIGGSYNKTMTAEVVDLCHEDYGTGHGIVFMMQNSLASTGVSSPAGPSVNWSNCTLRSTIQNNVIPALPSELQDVIKEVPVKYTSTVTTAQYSGSNVQTVNDKVFIPAVGEMNYLTSYPEYVSEGKPFAKFKNGPLAYPDFVWFRSISRLVSNVVYVFYQDSSKTSLMDYTTAGTGGVFLVFCI